MRDSSACGLKMTEDSPGSKGKLTHYPALPFLAFPARAGSMFPHAMAKEKSGPPAWADVPGYESRVWGRRRSTGTGDR